MNRRLVLTFVTALLLGGSLIAKPTSAVTLIPPTLEFLDVQPGATFETKVKLFNETAEPITLFSSTANFTSLDETGTPNILIDAVTKEGLASWIKLEPGPYALKAGERVEIPTTIAVPSDATPGGHYASILFSPQETEATGSGQVAIGQKIGTLVLVRVAGIVNESGKIATLTTSTSATSFSRLPVSFALRFQNTGNVHLRPVGNLTVRNMLGGTSAVLPMNSNQGAVLPQSIRRFDIAWEKELGAETRGGFFTELGREWNNFALGPYTASVELSYGLAKDKTDTATFKFWVFPWRVLLVTLLLIVLLIWLIIWFVKRYNRWIVSKASQGAKK